MHISKRAEEIVAGMQIFIKNNMTQQYLEQYMQTELNKLFAYAKRHKGRSRFLGDFDD